MGMPTQHVFPVSVAWFGKKPIPTVSIERMRINSVAMLKHTHPTFDPNNISGVVIDPDSITIMLKPQECDNISSVRIEHMDVSETGTYLVKSLMICKDRSIQRRVDEVLNLHNQEQ